MAHIAKPMRRHWAPVLEAALQLLLSDFTSRAHHKQYYLLPRLVLRPLARTGKGKAGCREFARRCSRWLAGDWEGLYEDSHRAASDH